jgi:hypothetical protein
LNRMNAVNPIHKLLLSCHYVNVALRIVLALGTLLLSILMYSTNNSQSALF